MFSKEKAPDVQSATGPATGARLYSIDNLMLLFSAVQVLFMQAGLAALESGLGPQTNTDNIMFKNFTDLYVGTSLFFLVGYSIMKIYVEAPEKAVI